MGSLQVVALYCANRPSAGRAWLDLKLVQVPIDACVRVWSANPA